MRILTKYIVKEHQPPFFFALAVIMFVFVTKFIVQYIGKLFGKGLAYSTIFEFVYLNLAWMLALAVPMSVLVASLMAFGRLSADNEITVLKSSGINLYQIIRPALIWAAMLTIAMVWYNDRVLPEFNHQARLLARSISQKKPTFELEEGIYMNIKDINILVEEVERPLDDRVVENNDVIRPDFFVKNADKLKRITIFDYSEPRLQRIIVADYGYLAFDREREQLVFNLFEGEIHEIDANDFAEYRRLKFTRNSFNIEASDQVFKRVETAQRGDREMTIAMMRAEVQSYQQKRIEADSLIHAEVARYFTPPDTMARWLARARPPSAPLEWAPSNRNYAISKASRELQGLWQKVNAQISQRRYYDRQIYRYLVEIHKKYSIPFACIVFVLIGAPLGIRARKGSLGVGISFSIGFFLLYWACLIGGEELADRQLVVPFLAMWFPNIIVGAFGVYLTIRTVRETRFIQWQRLPRFLRLFLRAEAESG